ncbi:MAG: hypothetical protein OXF68_01380 [Gammaproteobacteria bacterium]|nr:hypothetical protein [Gammaproteobacteria bacterium]
MAISSVIDISKLDKGYVLAPERYDPRRGRLNSSGPCLSDFVNVLRDQVNPSGCRSADRFLVLDTGDAHNGVVKPNKVPVDGSSIKSAKKRIQPAQVVISRLRPYLRQVAWIDPGLRDGKSQNVELLCSTEFFVLGSADGNSIAFLAPFLLSPHIQSILAASQEGGHHPRFNERTLRSLPIPKQLIERRSALSEQVERAVNKAREAYRIIQESVVAASELR